jgi:hypothetical protein
MKNTIHHFWSIIPGFRTHQCERCGVIRYWDNEFKRLMYKTKWKIWYYGMPKCVMPNTKIDG